jgi:hypothetical protein
METVRKEVRVVTKALCVESKFDVTAGLGAGCTIAQPKISRPKLWALGREISNDPYLPVAPEPLCLGRISAPNKRTTWGSSVIKTTQDASKKADASSPLGSLNNFGGNEILFSGHRTLKHTVAIDFHRTLGSQTLSFAVQENSISFVINIRGR